VTDTAGSSAFASALDLPDGLAVPGELDRAWSWMEQQGFLLEPGDSSGRTFLTPYADERQLGVVFDTGATLRGWFGDDEIEARVARHVRPIAEISGDGGFAALWLHDGSVRFVAMSSDGEAYVLADSALDFLRLIAIGYDELSSFAIGQDVSDLDPDEDEFLLECVAALGPFRAWVEQEFDTAVPTSWHEVDPDDNDFARWVSEQSANPGA
jgi:hypothetical protein